MTRTTTLAWRLKLSYCTSLLPLAFVGFHTTNRDNTPTRLDIFMIVIPRPMVLSPLSACLRPLTRPIRESGETEPVSRHFGGRWRVGWGWCQRTIPLLPLFIIPRRRYPNSFIRQHHETMN